jgi:hypothetical protein
MGTSEQIDKTHGHLLPDALDRTRQALDAFVTPTLLFDAQAPVAQERKSSRSCSARSTARFVPGLTIARSEPSIGSKTARSFSGKSRL